MANKLLEILRAMSLRLEAVIPLSRQYPNALGKGEMREVEVIAALRTILPPNYAIEKGVIFDSNGNESKEIDIVIYERDELFSGIEVGGRRYIPVESVYGIIEVKTKLDKKEFDNSCVSIKSIEGLQRHYRAEAGGIVTSEDFTVLNKGIAATTTFLNIGKIWSGIFAYDSVKDEVLQTFLQMAPSNLIFICIPGREMVMRWFVPKGFKGLRLGEDALGIFAWGILDLLSTNSRKKSFTPNVSLYREKIINSLGTIDAWELMQETKKPK